MKKVLSVTMASAMVLGMGANAFAVKYDTSSNDTASWPTDFRFEEPLFVIDKDGKFVSDSRTDLNDNQNFDFLVGDEIYMPLSAANQTVYNVDGANPNLPAVAKTTVVLKATDDVAVENLVTLGEGANNTIDVNDFTYLNTADKVLYWYGYDSLDDAVRDSIAPDNDWAGWRGAKITSVGVYKDNKSVSKWTDVYGSYNKAQTDKVVVTYDVVSKTVDGNTVLEANVTGRHWESDNEALTIDELSPAVEAAINKAIKLTTTPSTDNVVTTSSVSRAGTYEGFASNVTVKAVLPAVAAVNGSDGKFVIAPIEDNSNNQFEGQKRDGIYTGNVDKNWSINLVEDTHSAGKVTDIVESAEFYRATTADVAKYGDVFEPKGVYVKVKLKEFFDSVDSADLKYYAYVANNSNSSRTNQVIVSGTYKNNGTKTVSFKWTNNANEPAVWKVAKGENGTAVFDFKDLAFFTVKMYSEEKMYLDMDSAYQKAVANEWDADFDSFYKFKGTNANFAREGELILKSDDANLNVYQITADGDLVPVDSAYVEDYQIVHTGEKISGYVFNTKELGNFVLSADSLEAEEEETPIDEEPTPDVEEPTPVAPVEQDPKDDNTVKNNPNTGADDFVGVAVALAVVSVAAAGALALKK